MAADKSLFFDRKTPRRTNVLASALLVAVLLGSSTLSAGQADEKNPFFNELNVPVDYADVTAQHVSDYAEVILESTDVQAAAIASRPNPTFDNVVRAFDALAEELNKASSNAFILFWVSPDSAIRAAGLEAYQKLEVRKTALYSDRAIFDRIKDVQDSEHLTGIRSKLVSDLLLDMRQTGVELEPDELQRFKDLRAEIDDLSTRYSTNMNTDVPILEIDEDGALGLSDNFKSTYAREEGVYAIPVMPSTQEPVMSNAESEDTRRRYYMAFYNRATEENLPILDTLVARRHELGTLMGARSFAEYRVATNMANTPEIIWDFLGDLTDRAKEKAVADLDELVRIQADLGIASGDSTVRAWDSAYLKNVILKRNFGVDNELVREYLPMQPALRGMMDLYEQLLGLEFRQVDNPSVWHEEVEAYEVYEAGKLVGRFYLDLFPRPDKESWYYGMSFSNGRMHEDGYELPIALLLGNFTRPTDELPSLLSHFELLILFHEFGHVMNGVSYRGEFALQSGSRRDFGEAMSQIFENWIWDYDVLKTFARHYETGEVLPREIFDNMLAAKNVGSGIQTQNRVRLSTYDMMLYDRYDPDHPTDTDQLWDDISDRFVYAPVVEGTHRQASWIHINGWPTYMYGYLWSAVYSADMFTQFEDRGLRDAETGTRYRELILANGTQRPIEEVVEEFLGRPMNSEAYIRSLGL